MKICKRCTHCTKKDVLGNAGLVYFPEYFCYRDIKTKINLVTGDMEETNTPYKCSDERNTSDKFRCGPEGRFFYPIYKENINE